MRRVLIRWLPIVVCLLLAVARPVSASSVLIGNLPFANTGSYNLANTIPGEFAAVGFTMGSQDFDLASATMFLVPLGGTVDVVLSSTPFPFTPLVSLTGPLSTTPSVVAGEYTFTPTSAFTLLAGTTYYLVYSPIGAQVTWLGDIGDTATGPFATDAGFFFGGTSFPGFTFEYQIEGDAVAVPEPSLLALVGIGAVSALRKRRRQLAR